MTNEYKLGQIAAKEVKFGKPYLDEFGFPQLHATYQGDEIDISVCMDLSSSEYSFCLGELYNPITKSKDWIRGFRSSLNNIARTRFKVELTKKGEWKLDDTAADGSSSY